ncbi:MAG: hypothetical protein Q9174_001033 [Haloplaca sp. 1 TL-2023]
MPNQRPTSETYVLCFEGIAETGDSESLVLVQNMLKLDNQVEPDTRLYNALMLAYIAMGDPRESLLYWDDIIHSREGPTYNSIQIALRACEDAPFGERQARDIWNRLKRFEIKVTREIYAAYVGALAGQSLFDECVELINTAEKEAGYTPDVLLLGTFHNALPDVKQDAMGKWAQEAYPKVWDAVQKLSKHAIQSYYGKAGTPTPSFLSNVQVPGSRDQQIPNGQIRCEVGKRELVPGSRTSTMAQSSSEMNFAARMDLRMTVDWTPPKPKSSSARVSSQAFLNQISAEELQRKIAVDSFVPDRYSLTLDPPPRIEDQTIQQYHSRLMGKSSAFAEARQKLKITMPLPPKIINLAAKNADLCSSNATLEHRLDELTRLVESNSRTTETRLEEMRLSITQEFETRLEEMGLSMTQDRTVRIRNHEEYVAWRHEQDSMNLRLHKANFVPIFVGVLCARTGVSMKSIEKKKTDDTHCSSRFAKAYTLFEPFSRADPWRKRTGLEHQYYKDLKRVDKLLQDRNQAAHETSSAFARLLNDPVFLSGPNKAESEYYEPLFSYCYARIDGSDMTLAECAELDDSILKTRLRTHPDEQEAAKKPSKKQPNPKKTPR